MVEYVTVCSPLSHLSVFNSTTYPPTVQLCPVQPSKADMEIQNRFYLKTDYVNIENRIKYNWKRLSEIEGRVVKGSARKEAQNGTIPPIPIPIPTHRDSTEYSMWREAAQQLFQQAAVTERWP